MHICESEYRRVFRDNLIRQYAPIFKLDPADLVGRDIEANPFGGPAVKGGQILDRKPTTVTSVQRISE